MAKATKKHVLGRGLKVILKKTKKENKVFDKLKDLKIGSVIKIPIELIEVNPFQPRSKFNSEKLNELAASIKEFGIIQPVTLRRKNENSFQLLSGERRLRASSMVGLKKIPAYIREANDQEALEIALVENIQRKDLDSIEIAMSYKRLMDDINLTQTQISDRVGKKRSTVTNYLRLLKLDPIIQTGIRDGFITMGHGRTLVNIKDSKDQLKAYEKIITKQLSVRETENLTRNLNFKGQKNSNNHSVFPSYADDLKENITNFFNRPISIKMNKKNGGKIIIPFKSKNDYEFLIKLLNEQK
tara:strand:+ start:221 stop:1117 length:897 start_codon:yes stop_codon:yes gene_type:complete